MTIVARDLNAWVGAQQVLRGISLELPAKKVSAIIGPMGCGKSVFVRCVNRMHELKPRTRVSGVVEIEGKDIYGSDVDPVALRRRVGMVFQTPNPFPGLTIAEDVIAGLRLTGVTPPAGAAEALLRKVELWDEVKDHLEDPATMLNVGQQQRLCIARALSLEPEVLLLDEPCSDLDPTGTAKIEDLIHTLRQDLTIVIVCHHPSQAARVSDTTAFFLDGKVIEYSRTDLLFTSPKDPRTEDYITGKFG